MENKDPKLMLTTQAREALALILVIVLLIVISYLLTAFIMHFLLFPFGTLEDFSACCNG